MSSKLKAGTSTSGAVLDADTTGILELQTGSTPTTAVTIDTSQNVGINTTSPAYKLDAVVTGNSLNSIIAARNTTSGTSAGSQILVGNDSSNDLLVMRALSSTYTSSGVNTANGALVRGGGAGGMTLAATDGSGIINFATGGTTERMRIDSSGNVIMGNTSYDYSANGFGFGAGNAYSYFTRTSGYALLVNLKTTTGAMQAFTYNQSGIGNISTNGSNCTFNSTSDYRLKQNVKPMTGALAKVDLLKPVTYNWIRENQAGEGFIAHELQEVVPEAVVGKKDAVNEDGNPVYQAIDQSVLVATLTAAIQELNAKVIALEAKVGA